MPVDRYLLFVSVVTLIVISPGPNLFMLLGLAPGNTRSVGLVAAVGIAAAVLCHAALALLGVGAIIATSAVLFTALKVAGAAYLIWLGLKSLWSARRGTGLVTPAGSVALSARRSFLRGYLTNILNPKPAVFYVAAFPQFLSPHESGFLLSGAVLGLTHAAIALAFYGTIVLLVGRVTRVLLRPAVSAVVKSVAGLALVLLGGGCCWFGHRAERPRL